MASFGIYILTYPGDFHLAGALIKSLRHFSPDVPIMIIPGRGFDRHDHPFSSVPVMPAPGGFWQEQGHIDRKFWSFQGPYERFLYLDADVICLRPLSRLMDRIRIQREAFVFGQTAVPPRTWKRAVNDVCHPLHHTCMARLRGQLGNIENLADFDPAYRLDERYPINAGVFASARFALQEDHFRELYEREAEFYRRELGKAFTWDSHDLFFGDQGRLNYLIWKQKVPLFDLYPEGHYLWGGRGAVRLEQVLAARARFTFIHWAGCPRPSPSKFSETPLLRLLASTYAGLPEDYGRLDEVPALRVWERFSYDGRQGASALGTPWWTLRDGKRLVLHYGRVLLRPVKRCVKGTWRSSGAIS